MLIYLQKSSYCHLLPVKDGKIAICSSLNDFPHCLSRSSPNMYSDGATVTYSAEDIEAICDYLNEELANISEWMPSIKLSLNPSKSEFLIVGQKRQLNSIQEC